MALWYTNSCLQLKYGVGSNPNNLVWMIGGQEKWGTPFTADTWFNFAYDIDVRTFHTNTPTNSRSQVI